MQTQITLTADDLNANIQVPTSSYLSNFISNKHKAVPMLTISQAALHITQSSQVRPGGRGMLGIHLSVSGLQAQFQVYLLDVIVRTIDVIALDQSFPINC